MEPRSPFSLVVGILTMTYGTLLLLFWGGNALLGGWEALTQISQTPAVTVLFLATPFLLLLTGWRLCRSGGGGLTLALVAVSALVLCVKAALAWHWAIAAVQKYELISFGGLAGGLTSLVLIGFVACPSSVWGPLLAGTAVALLTRPQPAPEGKPESASSWRGLAIAGVVLLALAGQAGLVGWQRAMLPDLAGLEGTWRDPINPKHSYHFINGGELESSWESLSHGVIATWTRSGTTIHMRCAPDWQQFGNRDGTLDGDTIRWRVSDAQPGLPDEIVWSRDP